MGKAAAARKLASAAASAGAACPCSGRSLYGLLRAEATVARRAIGSIDGQVPDATGWYGRGRPGPAIKIAMLGDSSAAGYGVDTVEETPGALLGSGVAAGAEPAGAPARVLRLRGEVQRPRGARWTPRCPPSPTSR